MNRLFQGLILIYSCLVAMVTSANEITAIGDDTRIFGPYTVYYSTFNSLFIPAEMAQLHNLVRAKDQTLLTIAVKETSTGKAVAAQVDAIAKNLLQQSQAVALKTISEADSFYYIGAVRHANEELFHIDVTIKPNDGKSTYRFRISRKLYTE